MASEYHEKMAAVAPTYGSLQDLVEFSIQNRKAAYGWICGMFYQAYPGGRTINWAVRSIAPREERVM